jgi:NitT/TauT family transport system permease protein
MTAAVMSNVSGPGRPSAWPSWAYTAAGVSVALVLWAAGDAAIQNPQFRAGFAPVSAFRALIGIVSSRVIVDQGLPSLARVAGGLGIATGLGVPMGVFIGYFRTLHLLTNTAFQFGRMTSPLAWMPLAIIAFGVGNRPVVVLIAVAAVWPIMISTANGVRNVDLTWIRVAQMLGANRRGVVRHAIIPAALPDMLVGIRISVGVAWIILVPAEMLGVSSGLGYYILDARDRFNYAELMAVILIIGFLGYVSDSILAAIQRRFSWRDAAERVDS